MNSESTAAAPAIEAEVIHGEAMVRHGAGQLAALPQMTPEVFKAQVEREEEMRSILKDYVQRNMKAGYHFSTKLGTVELPKPILLQEGARNICSLFKLFFGEPQITEEHHRDDHGSHYRVRTHVGLFNADGRQIASGDAVCSTRESKYAYRKGNRVCPDCGKADAIIKGKAQYGGGWVCYEAKGGCKAKFEDNDSRITDQQLGRIDNPDKADVENTVLKMSVKRAKVAAVCDVAMVSEIFAPEGDDDSARGREGVKERQEPKAKTGGGGSAPAPAQPNLVADDPKEASEVLGEIHDLMKIKCGDGEVVDEEAARAFLKGRDPSVMPLEALKKLRGDLAAL